MDIYISKPGDWEVSRILFELRRPGTDEYTKVMSMLYEIDRLVVLWEKYHYLSKRRMTKGKHEMYMQLERDYFMCINGMLNYCSKAKFWENLQG